MSNIEADELLRVADDDIVAARTLLSGTPPRLTTAAYHAQQAGEKAVKAALRQLGITYAKVHDIGVNAARIPAGTRFATHATKLVIATPWATQSRYNTTTPPTAQEIEQALSDTLSLTSAIAQSLPSPTSELATGLAKTTPGKWLSKRLVGLWVDPSLIADAKATPKSSDAPVTVAFRVVAESCVHQPEYDLTQSSMPPTGRYLYEWNGVDHLQDLLLAGNKTSPKARLYLNALKLDEAVQAYSGLAVGFTALLKLHRGHEPPENPPPPKVIGGGRSVP